MNVVVSAIVDPWVTTLSFVVALAIRIQEAKGTDSLQKSGAHWIAQLPTHRTTSRLCSYRWRTARLANRNAPVGGHPGPEEIENCGNDGQNDDGGN